MPVDEQLATANNVYNKFKPHIWEYMHTKPKIDK